MLAEMEGLSASRVAAIRRSFRLRRRLHGLHNPRLTRNNRADDVIPEPRLVTNIPRTEFVQKANRPHNRSSRIGKKSAARGGAEVDG
jgi:hypothetical protein